MYAKTAGMTFCSFLIQRVFRFRYACNLAYFSFVANPPRKCRSSLFTLKTSDTCAHRFLLIPFSLCVTSLCTVDFEIPNFAAAARTVAFCSTI